MWAILAYLLVSIATSHHVVTYLGVAILAKSLVHRVREAVHELKSIVLFTHDEFLIVDTDGKRNRTHAHTAANIKDNVSTLKAKKEYLKYTHAKQY